MDNGNLKNTVILRNLKSNFVEEAIVILKKNCKVKKYNTVNNYSDNGQFDGDYITEEAEMIVQNYIEDIENDEKIKKYNLIYKKYKLIKRIMIVSLITIIVEGILIIL